MECTSRLSTERLFLDPHHPIAAPHLARRAITRKWTRDGWMGLWEIRYPYEGARSTVLCCRCPWCLHRAHSHPLMCIHSIFFTHQHLHPSRHSPPSPPFLPTCVRACVRAYMQCAGDFRATVSTSMARPGAHRYKLLRDSTPTYGGFPKDTALGPFLSRHPSSMQIYTEYVCVING